MRNPLYRSGYALVVNTAGTTFVGIAYWAVAAHLYSREALGRASALIAALLLVSSFTQLNLAYTLPQFVPRAGRRAGRLIAYSYGVSSAAALAVGVTFVLVMPELSSRWRFLGDSEVLTYGFIFGAVIWGTFALEDAALLSLRRSAVVPVENTVYGVAKLLLLVAMVAVYPGSGIFLSWVLPLAVIVPVINWLIFRRFLKDWPAAGDAATVFPREIVRFASADYLGSMVGQAYVNLPPLLVLSVLGAEANGSFAVAWTIAAGPALLAGNFATSLLVEGAAAPERLTELTRGVLARSTAVTTAGAAVLIVAARPILGFYGPGYAAHASLLLGLLAASTVPQGLIAITFSLDRLAGRLGRAAVTRLVLAILALGGSWLLLGRLGINGVGLAWLIANFTVAMARTPTIVGAIRRRPATAPAAMSPAANGHGIGARPQEPARDGRPAAGRHRAGDAEAEQPGAAPRRPVPAGLADPADWSDPETTAAWWPFW